MNKQKFIKKDAVKETAKGLINWCELSKIKTGSSRDSIRSNRIPDKHLEDVNILLYYIESWLNCRDLTTKEEVLSETGDKIREELQTIVTKIHDIGKTLII